MGSLVGRVSELGRLSSVLEDDGPRAVVVTGAPGLGKTALVEAFHAAATGRPVRILRARPLEAESPLAFSALAELLSTVDEREYDALPGPQRSALRTVLLLDETDQPVDARAVAAGVGAVLAALADREPVLVLVDDAQWLDDATTHTLARGLRAVTGTGVRVVAATRPTRRAPGSWLPDWPVVAIDLGGMSAGELASIVHYRLGVRLDPAAQRTLGRAAEGNPLYAVELARHHTGDAGRTFRDLLGARTRALPRETRLAVLAAALASTPTTEVLAQARCCSPAELVNALEPAVVDDLVRVTDRVEFGHPLYAAAVVEQAAEPDVRACHERLAEVAPNDEARARHLGAARSEPDLELATRLESTAQRLRRRGAVDSAIDLLQLGVRRTPDGSGEWDRRAELLGLWLLVSGRGDDAMTWFRRVRERGPSHAYWDATIHLATALLYAGRKQEARPLADELETAELDPAQQVQAVVSVHGEWRTSPRELLAQLTLANAGLREAGDRPGLLATGLALEARIRREAALPDQHLVSALQAEAQAWEAAEPPPYLMEGVALQLAQETQNAGRLEEARDRYHVLLRRCAELGDDFSVPIIIAQLARAEMRAGNWATVLELLDDAAASAEGQGQMYSWLIDAQRAEIAALTGDREGAEALLRGPIEAFAALDDPTLNAIAWSILGRVQQMYGEADAAYVSLCRAEQLRRDAYWDDPADMRLECEVAEAAMAVGRMDEAETILAEVEGRAYALGRTAVLAECGRVRLALAAARGDLDDAASMVSEMLEGVERDEYEPYRRGRAYLLAGKVLRRTKQKRAAHEALSTALGIFDGLGCVPYLEQTRAELSRVGLRPSAPSRLTGAEHRVATLAAEGLRNAEIAEAAFISVKTVEATLGRAYRKLGISRRAEIARALDALEP